MVKNKTKSNEKSANQRTVAPNSEEIKRLRNEKGLTQNALVEDPNVLVGLKNYQRAEQGQPIGLQFFESLAAFFDVPVDQIIKNRTDVYDRTIILTRKDPPSASDLLSILCYSSTALDIRFDVDPNKKEAENIAWLCSTMEEIERGISFSDPYFDMPAIERPPHSEPAARILVIGQMNQRLLELADQNIFIFYKKPETYYEEHYCDDLMDDPEAAAVGASIRAPGIRTKNFMEIVFSKSENLLLTIEMRPYYMRKSEAMECLVNEMIDLVVDPADLPKSWHSRLADNLGFKEKYELEFEQRYSHLTLKELKKLRVESAHLFDLYM